jgi:hypothetical protein
MAFTEQYDVAVVGAGHAGCEAAMAAARMGLKTALITMNLDLIAQMSCNPAVGGVAKGHLVREVDALGGVMGEVADAVGIQFRLLNTSRGPAVWSPRAQCDKQLYRVKMREVLEAQAGLHIRQAEVVDLVVDEGPGTEGLGTKGLRDWNWLHKWSCERARLQSCRKGPMKSRALAPEGCFPVGYMGFMQPVLVPTFLLNLRPRIFQRQRPVEDQLLGRRVRIEAEIAHALELEAVL